MRQLKRRDRRSAAASPQNLSSFVRGPRAAGARAALVAYPGQTLAALSLDHGTAGPALSGHCRRRRAPADKRGNTMSPHVATSTPVRSDVSFAEDPPATTPRSSSRLWALSGLGAGVLG